MAKRERKAWILIGQRGNAVVIDSRYCADVDRGQMFVGGIKRYCSTFEEDREQVVRCTITWDDGKPAKAKKTRKRNG